MASRFAMTVKRTHPTRGGGESTERKSPKQIADRLGEYGILPLEFAIVEKGTWFLQIAVAQCIPCSQELRSRARPGSQGFYNSKLRDHKRACKGTVTARDLVNSATPVPPMPPMPLDTLYQCSLCKHLTFDSELKNSHSKRHNAELKGLEWSWESDWQTSPNVIREEVVESSRNLVLSSWHRFICQEPSVAAISSESSGTEDGLSPPNASNRRQLNMNQPTQMTTQAMRHSASNTLTALSNKNSKMLQHNSQSRMLHHRQTTAEGTTRWTDRSMKDDNSPVDFNATCTVYPQQQTGSNWFKPTKVNGAQQHHTSASHFEFQKQYQEWDRKENSVEEGKIRVADFPPTPTPDFDHNNGNSATEYDDHNNGNAATPYDHNTNVSLTSTEFPITPTFHTKSAWSLDPLTPSDVAVGYVETESQSSSKRVTANIGASDSVGLYDDFFDFTSRQGTPQIDTTNLENIDHADDQVLSSSMFGQLSNMDDELETDSLCTINTAAVTHRFGNSTLVADLDPAIARLHLVRQRSDSSNCHSLESPHPLTPTTASTTTTTTQYSPFGGGMVSPSSWMRHRGSSFQGLQLGHERKKMDVDKLHEQQRNRGNTANKTVNSGSFDDVAETDTSNKGRRRRLRTESALLDSPDTPSSNSNCVNGIQSKKLKVHNYRGLSIAFLQFFWGRVQRHEEAPDVSLYVTKVDIKTRSVNVEKGDTLSLRSKTLGRWECWSPTHGRVVVRPHQVEAKPRERWTSQDLEDYVVKDATLAEQCCYTDLLLNSHDPALQDAVGPEHQGAFVIQARRTPFQELLDALKAYYTTGSETMSQVSDDDREYLTKYVWIDIFGENHALVKRAHEEVHRDNFAHLKGGVHDAISQFGECLLMLNSWENPLSLQRAWCLWELYGALERGVGFHVCLTAEVAARFSDVLVHEYDTLIHAILNVNLRDAKCNNYAEQVEIHYWTKGKTALIEKLVQEQLRKWFVHTAELYADDALRGELAEDDVEFVVMLISRTGRLLKDQGQYNKAKERFESAITLSGERLGKDHYLYASCVTGLAGVLSSLSRYPIAEQRYSEALMLFGKMVPEPITSTDLEVGTSKVPGILAATKKVVPSSNSLTIRIGQGSAALAGTSSGMDLRLLETEYATALHDYATLLCIQARYRSSQAYFDKALEIRGRLHGTHHPDYAETLGQMAECYYRQGKYDVAEKLYIEAGKTTSRLLGENHPKVASNLKNLAELHELRGKYYSSLELNRKALAIRERTVGKENGLYASTLISVAGSLTKLGRVDEAQRSLQMALEIQQRVLGPEHESFAMCLAHMGDVLTLQGKYADAEKHYRNALKIRQKNLGEEHELYARSLYDLAEVLQKQGKYAAVEELYSQAEGILLQVLGDGFELHESRATILSRTAELYQIQGKYDLAEARFRQALAIRKKVLGENHELYARSLNNLAGLLVELGKFDDVEKLHRQAIEIKRSVLGEQHESYATSLVALGKFCVVQQRWTEAESLLRKALTIRLATLGTEHELYAQCLDLLSQVLHKTGKLDEAQELQSKSLEIKREALGPGHESYATGLRTMADLKETLGHREVAEALHCQALQINSQALGSDHPKATESRSRVAAVRALAKYNASPKVPIRQQPAHIKEEFEGQRLFLDFDRDIKDTLDEEVLVAGMKRMRFPALDPKEAARRLMRSCAKNPESGKISRDEFNAYFKKISSNIARIRALCRGKSNDSPHSVEFHLSLKQLRVARENGMFKRTLPSDTELEALVELINDRDAFVKVVMCCQHQDLDDVLKSVRKGTQSPLTE